MNHLKWRNILLPLLLLLCSGLSYAQQQIIILTSDTGGTYQQFTDAFTEVSNKKDDLIPDVKIKILSISDSLPHKSKWQSTNTILITVGTKAAQLVASMELDAPVVNAMLPFSTYQKITGKAKTCASSTAIYIDQPIRRQLDLSKEIFPDLSRYGILLGDTSEKRYAIEKELHGFPSEMTKTMFIKKSKELAWSLRSLSEQVDVFIALNDPLVFNPNNAKWFLYMAYQERKPVIGFSRPYVTAGASASVYTTPSQLGRQAAEMIFEQRSKENKCLFKPQYPRYFKISVNKAVIESLSGRELSEKILHERLLQREQGLP